MMPEYLLQSYYYDMQMEEGMPGVVMGDESQFAVAERNCGVLCTRPPESLN